MTRRTSRLRIAAASAIALLAAPVLQAQTSRDWSVCFGTGVSSCTDLYLTTAATLGGQGGSRDGTQVSLTVVQRDRGMPSALMGFSFGLGASTVNQADVLKTLPTPVGGAQPSAATYAWLLHASLSTSDPSANYFYGYGGSDPTQAPSQTAWIGGCGSPSSNAWWIVDNVACGSGQGFSFFWNTSVFFDADLIQTVGVDVLAIDQDALEMGTGGGYCVGSAAGGAGVGFDGYDPSNAFPCEISRAGPPVAVVPEPHTIALFAAGLLMLGAMRLRRRAV
jgi:hypothetical protein